MNEIPSNTCDKHHKLVPLRSHDIKNQDDKRYPCGAWMQPTYLAQASMCCPKVPMRLRIEEALLVTEPCSSASQVISEDSDLYRPFK